MVSDARFMFAQLVLEVDDPPACHTLADLPRDAAASHALLQVRGGITHQNLAQNLGRVTVFPSCIPAGMRRQKRYSLYKLVQDILWPT
jgi:hypothetical protein